MILLDTCALLWLDSNRNIFSSEAMVALDRYSDALAISPVSFMEIGIKTKKGKLELSKPLVKWIDEICTKYSLTILPVTKAVAIQATQLPEIHRDPFDKIIIATAVVNRLKVLSADKTFKEYNAIKVIW